MAENTSATYTGRFAPSPTGPLHFGSLISALASYLDARAHQGHWLVRMEDLDPPREQPGAADDILRSLEDHGLLWEGSVIYQSDRHDAYNDTLAQLQAEGKLYRCGCTRQRLQQIGGVYDGLCQQQPPDADALTALRITVAGDSTLSFNDAYQGLQQQNLSSDVGDFILRRKDGLFAYQLAVVVDDIYQGINHIIRGSDLLDSTPRQLWLYRCLNAVPPAYGHIPVALNRAGQKLSKQNLAPALDSRSASQNLWQALQFLQQSPPLALQGAPCEELLNWATDHWQPKAIPNTLGIAI